MIPIHCQQEPLTFDSNVRQKGRDFLQTTPTPTTEQWKGHEYWRDALGDLRAAYGGICAYCCEYVPPTTGGATVEHVQPKSKFPENAYEWNNFLFVSSRFNSRKKDFEDVLNPFSLAAGWFIMDFPSLQLKPGNELTDGEKKQVDDTVKRLKLNDDVCIRSRREWVKQFVRKRITFHYLQEKVPFLAMEIERQDLIQDIARVLPF